MYIVKPIARGAAVALFAMAPELLTAPVYAQTTPAPGNETSSPSSSPPGFNLPESERPATDLTRKGIEVPPAAIAQGRVLLGLPVFGSDGQRVGEVTDVRTLSDGKVTEIHIRTGGFLGFFTRKVSIPSDRFSKSGPNVLLELTAEDIGKLPSVNARQG
jgi:sporulation protein YlmC with PRC-barrel domain